MTLAQRGRIWQLAAAEIPRAGAGRRTVSSALPGQGDHIALQPVGLRPVPGLLVNEMQIGDDPLEDAPGADGRQGTFVKIAAEFLQAL